MNLISAILILFLLITPAIAQETHHSAEGKVAIPLGNEEPDTTTQATPKYSEEEKRKLVTELGVVYEGMPKEDLEKAGFTKHMLIYHDKQGREEYMSFSDWTTHEKGDTITFYILDGKVQDWFKGEGIESDLEI